MPGVCDVIEHCLEGEALERHRSQPIRFLLIDESTDMSTSKNLIIYFIYLKVGVQVVSYAALLHAPAVDAEAITDILLSYLEDNDLPISRVACFCSDGASVMTGCKGGVATRLKQVNPFMSSIHCIAQRLALGCADSADDVDYPTNSELTINEISAYFNRSPKVTVALSKLATECKIGRTKIVKSGKTRWLSREGVMVVLLKLFPTPVSHLVVYHVDFHGASSHMGIHVVKVDKLNHDKNHMVIHVVLQRKYFYNANETC